MLRNFNTSGSGGLRTKYFPKNRIGHNLISAAPWLSVILLIICFVMLESKFVLQQGVVVDLPESSFKGMIDAEMVLVVRSVEGSGHERREIVFFDDERFLVAEAVQMNSLKELFLEKSSRVSPESGVLIYADSSVKQGTLINMFNMVRDAGISKVNLASRPLEKLQE